MPPPGLRRAGAAKSHQNSFPCVSGDVSLAGFLNAVGSAQGISTFLPRSEHSRVLERIYLLPDAEQLELLLEDVLENAKRRQPNLRGAL
jgi:hypothetical protein